MLLWCLNCHYFILPHSFTRKLGPIVSKLTIYFFEFHCYIIFRNSLTLSDQCFAYLTVFCVISFVRLLFTFMSLLNVCTSDFTKVDMRENMDLTHNAIWFWSQRENRNRTTEIVFVGPIFPHVLTFFQILNLRSRISSQMLLSTSQVTLSTSRRDDMTSLSVFILHWKIAWCHHSKD